jgi:integrase
MYRMHPDRRRDHGYHLAEKLLAQMQADVERNCFRIEKYTGLRWTDVIEFYEEWLESQSEKCKPATMKAYRSYLKCWIGPFFSDHPVMLQDVQLDTLMALKRSLKLTGKGKLNVMMAFHKMMRFAWRSKRIPELPPFPELAEYGIIPPEIKWLSRDDFWKVIDQIQDDEQRAPFLWLYYHFRREGEACALHKTDYDPVNDCFTIRRSVSARKLVDGHKTSATMKRALVIACAPEFTPVARRLLNQNPDSPFLFVNPRSRRQDEGGRHTLESLRNIWYPACDRAGVKRISPYRGTKHTGCTHFLQDGGSVDGLQILTQHARRESVLRYGEVTLQKQRDVRRSAGDDGRNAKVVSIEDRLKSF